MKRPTSPFLVLAWAGLVLLGGSSLVMTASGAPAKRRAPAAPASASEAPSPELLQWRAEYGPTHEQRMQWWRAARFGMFIHWGVYAVPAGVWQGNNVTQSGAEWIMNRGRIPVADYRKFCPQFNPVNFDADAWVQLARDAGMKYIVITAKHHDGFAMFHSRVDAFNIYDATPFQRDPLAELAAACRKHGIKLGFYYSQAQDWNHPGGAAAGSRTKQPVIDAENHWDPAQQGSMDDYIDRVAVPQVRELLTNYGEVAVLWWDTPVGMNTERAQKFLPLLKLQPNIITNNRLDSRKSTGDTETPENKIPPNGIPGKDWETCMTMNRTWGFRSYDHDWKTTETLVRNLVDIASKGGNYLLNVGPNALGEIPAPSVERLREVGAWMKVNGPAIYDTSPSPFKTQPAWGRITRKVDGSDTTLYLHVFNWPSDGKLVVPGLGGTIARAHLLRPDGAGRRQSLRATSGGGGVTIDVPAQAPSPYSSAVVLQMRGALQVE